jgi:hypothetical protein
MGVGNGRVLSESGMEKEWEELVGDPKLSLASHPMEVHLMWSSEDWGFVGIEQDFFEWETVLDFSWTVLGFVDTCQGRMAFDITVTDLDFTGDCFKGTLCIKDTEIGGKGLDNGQ